MKNKLKKHIEEMCSASLGNKLPDDILVFNINSDERDNFPFNVSCTNQFVVFLCFQGRKTNQLQDFKNMISTFTGKTITIHEEKDSGWLYWGEGLPVDEIQTTSCRPNKSDYNAESINWLKNTTILPAWLEKELFDVQMAIYEPDCKKFEHNLTLSDEDLKIYLGTYFPRSYTEAFCIIGNLFENLTFKKSWLKKDTVNILDIGCGNGGNLIGLLTALEKKCSKIECLNVTVIDGNKSSLDLLKNILERFESERKLKINLIPLLIKIKTVADLPNLEKDLFDIIYSSKMGCEIISKGDGLADNTYYDLLIKYSPLLSGAGIFILLDVTTKSENIGYYPQLLNEQTCTFVQNKTNFSTIIPISCHMHEEKCVCKCYTQKEFQISHRLSKCDRSRVAYRIIGHRDFVEKIHSGLSIASYIVQVKSKTAEKIVCFHSKQSTIFLDAYKITN